MTKICILEDDEKDTISRYSSLTQTSHEVYVVLDKAILRDTTREMLNSELSGAGFKPENISYGFENAPTDAAVYFCDGLKGKCINLAEKLGKDRGVKNSGQTYQRYRCRIIKLKTPTLK
jgi:hypothetical protein